MPSKTVMVSNLPKHISEAEVRGLVEVYGTIEKLVVAYEPWSGTNSTVAFVDMQDADAISAMVIEISRIEVEGKLLCAEQFVPAF